VPVYQNVDLDPDYDDPPVGIINHGDDAPTWDRT
jgi:hypothetical protein